MTKHPTKDYNLGVLYPHLIDEFHPKLNDKTIYEYNPSSRQKLYWKCDKHDYYQQSAKSRSNGSGCPYCSGNQPTPENNFEVKFPTISKQIHPTLNDNIKPSNFLPFSSKKVFWVCKENNNHIWKTSFAKRGSGQNCPYCSGNKIWKEEN